MLLNLAHYFIKFIYLRALSPFNYNFILSVRYGHLVITQTFNYVEGEKGLVTYEEQKTKESGEPGGASKGSQKGAGG